MLYVPFVQRHGYAHSGSVARCATARPHRHKHCAAAYSHISTPHSGGAMGDRQASVANAAVEQDKTPKVLSRRGRRSHWNTTGHRHKHCAAAHSHVSTPHSGGAMGDRQANVANAAVDQDKTPKVLSRRGRRSHWNTPGHRHKHCAAAYSHVSTPHSGGATGDRQANVANAAVDQDKTLKVLTRRGRRSR